MEPVSDHPVENNMSYNVVYQREDGSSAVESTSTLAEAVNTAERLKNDLAIDRPRIFETNEIRYDFEPYFRIRVIDDASAAVIGDNAIGGQGVLTESYGTEEYTEEYEVQTEAGAGYGTAGAVAGGAVAGGGSAFAADSFSEGFVQEGAAVEGSVGAPEVGTVGGLFNEDMPREGVAGSGDLASDVYEPAEAMPDLPDADVPDVDVPSADLPDADVGLAGVVPDADMPDSEMPIDLRDDAVPDADIDLTSDVASTPDIPDTGEKKKTGLFTKFVESLDGSSGRGADDVVEDLGGAAASSPNRGLFGR